MLYTLCVLKASKKWVNIEVLGPMVLEEVVHKFMHKF